MSRIINIVQITVDITALQKADPVTRVLYDSPPNSFLIKDEKLFYNKDGCLKFVLPHSLKN